MERLIVLFAATVGVLVFVALCVGVALVYRKLFGARIWITFLQRTGYRRKADPHAPVEAQAQLILGEIFRPEGVVRGPWIRDVEGQTLTYNSWMYVEDRATVTQESWQLELAGDIGFQVQIIERRVARPDFFQRLASVALGRDRRWGKLLAHEVFTGDRDFDARFVVLGDRPGTLPSFLLDPTVRQAIASLPEACMFAAQRWIGIDDPAGTLRRQHVGLGAVTPAAMMDREPPLHDHAAMVLAALARSIRAAA